MFRSIWSKSLRDYRVPILAWGIGLALLMFVGYATATTPVLAAFVSIAPLVGFLGEPVAMLTPAGYITFRYMETTLPLLLSFWTILAGARLLRGEEERGTMDVLLGTPQPRTRLLLEKIGALVLALLLLSQFTISRGAAAGGASGLLLLALLLNIAGREVSGSWLQYLSPFYYYNLNRPLIPSFTDTPAAALVLLGLGLLFAVLSAVLFARRDIGRAAFVWQRTSANGKHQAERSLSRAERAVSTRSARLRLRSAWCLP